MTPSKVNFSLKTSAVLDPCARSAGLLLQSLEAQVSLCKQPVA